MQAGRSSGSASVPRGGGAGSRRMGSIEIDGRIAHKTSALLMSRTYAQAAVIRLPRCGGRPPQSAQRKPSRRGGPGIGAAILAYLARLRLARWAIQMAVA